MKHAGKLTAYRHALLGAVPGSVQDNSFTNPAER